MRVDYLLAWCRRDQCSDTESGTEEGSQRALHLLGRKSYVFFVVKSDVFSGNQSQIFDDCWKTWKRFLQMGFMTLNSCWTQHIRHQISLWCSFNWAAEECNKESHVNVILLLESCFTFSDLPKHREYFTDIFPRCFVAFKHSHILL